MKIKKKLEIFRKGSIGYKTIFTDGLPGNGKSLVTSIISTLKGVEKISYIEEVEIILSLMHLGHLSKKTSIRLVDFYLDFKIYNQMMGRDINFRTNDISSVLNFHTPSIYKNRLKSVGDENVLKLIKKKKPILNLGTHHILPYLSKIINNLSNNIFCIEIVRHPAYLIKQISSGATGPLIGNLRNWTLHFNFKNKAIPYYATNWKKKFCNLNKVEKSVFFIRDYYKLIENKKILFNKKIFFLVFEKFVLNPNNYLKKICKMIGSKKTIFTSKYLKLHHVPRKKIADSLVLKVYKKLGWKKPIKNYTEKEELLSRMTWVKKRVDKDIFKIFLDSCFKYEKKYWRPQS